jgi:hypothetical protein
VSEKLKPKQQKIMSAFQKVEFEQGGLAHRRRPRRRRQRRRCRKVDEKPKLFSDVAKKNAATSSTTQAYVVTAGGGNDAAKSRTVQYATRCRLFAAGKCTFGARCHFRHDIGGAGSGDNSNGVSSGGDEEAVDQECGICMEMIAAKGERFGLLLGCVHAFCLTCIREWRAAAQQQRANGDDAARQLASTEAVRSCPVCRVFSPYVIPSVYFVADGERKLQLQDEFLLNTKRTRCRYWNGKPGSCQFGSSCFYQHINPDGTPGVDATRSYVDEDGIHVVPANDRHSLADFIVLPPTQKAASSSSSSAVTTTTSQDDDEAHLPKWARGLDENDAAQMSQFLQNNSARSTTNSNELRETTTTCERRSSRDSWLCRARFVRVRPSKRHLSRQQRQQQHQQHLLMIGVMMNKPSSKRRSNCFRARRATKSGGNQSPIMSVVRAKTV